MKKTISTEYQLCIKDNDGNAINLYYAADEFELMLEHIELIQVRSNEHMNYIIMAM